MSRLAIITFITPGGVDIDNGLPVPPAFPGQGLPGYGGGPVDPGYGRPGYSPVDPGYGQGRPNRPDQGLPGYGHPDQGLPGGGHIATLPVFPFDPTRPDGGLPPAQPEIDNSLPHPGIVPGAKFVVKWLACQGLILVPDNGLPTTPPPTGGNELPETPAPK